MADIAEIDWSDILTTIDLDAAVNLFTNKFKEVLNFHAPWILYQQRKHHKVWISKETKELMAERDKWKRKATALSIENRGLQSSQEEVEAWSEYKIIRNRVNNLKKNEEYRYKKFVISEASGSSKSTWNSIKHFMDWNSPGTPNQILVNNVLYRKAFEVATLLNDFFIEKVEKHMKMFRGGNLDLKGCQKIMDSKRCSLTLNFVSVKKIENLIRNLKSSKAVAVDELDSFSLKISAKYVAAPVHHLVTLSMMQQKFPTTWKFSKVLPLFKKGSQLDRKNYRPVSILSPISKILERVVHDQLYSYFANNHLFHPNVMGFRRNRSTMSCILQMYDRWVQGAGEGMISGVVLLDLSAAFDLVDSTLLVKKLKTYGLRTDIIAWLESYLCDRKQAVWVDHIFSDWRNVPGGLPQGSILGPLLFTIFSNDLPEFLSSEIEQYADDNTMSSIKPSIDEINVNLNENCQVISEWMRTNRMCLNADKTHLMICGTSHRVSKICQESINISMDNVSLQQSNNDCENVLGVSLQQNLKWTKHVQNLQSKLKVRLAGLRKIRNTLGFDKRNLIAKAIFESVLVYCIPAWGGTSKGDIEDLQVLQNRAAEFVMNLPGRSNREQMFLSLGWLTVHQLSVFHTIMAVYKIRNTKEPEYLARKLNRENVRGNIIVPNSHLTLLKRSFVFRGSELWNRLPLTIRNLEKVSEFKKELKKWVTDNISKFL